MITFKLIKFAFKLAIFAVFAATLFLSYDFYAVYKKSMADGKQKEIALFEAAKHSYERIIFWAGKAKELQQ